MDLALPEGIARESGGRVLPAIGAPAQPANGVFSATRSRGRVPSIPWLLLAGVVLLSADYLRRAEGIRR